MTAPQAVALAVLGYFLDRSAMAVEEALPRYGAGGRHLIASLVGAIGATVMWIGPILILVGFAR